MSSGSEAKSERPTELSIQEALRRCMQHAPFPFAVTRGADHALAYANTAFCDMTGIDRTAGLGTSIVQLFPPAEGEALREILDRAYGNSAEILDQRISPGDTAGGGLQCSVWPVVSGGGQS